jgi:nucleoid-associated protein YgaU
MLTPDVLSAHTPCNGGTLMPPFPGGDDPIDFSDVTGGGTTSGGPRTYVVKKGDSLSKIAKEMYGDAKLWKKIFEANKGTIKNANLIYPGQELTIPD